jgi:hypothetical protein
VANMSPHHISCQPLQPWIWPLSTGSPTHPYALHLPGLWIQESYELCTKQRNKTHHLITARLHNKRLNKYGVCICPRANSAIAKYTHTFQWLQDWLSIKKETNYSIQTLVFHIPDLRLCSNVLYFY